jgi:hypothetical protein
LIRSAEKLRDSDTRPDTEECRNETENQLWRDVEKTHKGDDGSSACPMFLCSISGPYDNGFAGDVAKGNFSAF